MHNSEDLKGISEGKIFVLDGQQRFEALYIGLYGSYQEKSGIIKELYFYLETPSKSDDFVFVSDNEYKEKNSNQIFLIKKSDLRKYNKDTVMKGLKDDVIKEIQKPTGMIIGGITIIIFVLIGFLFDDSKEEKAKHEKEKAKKQSKKPQETNTKNPQPQTETKESKTEEPKTEEPKTEELNIDVSKENKETSDDNK